MTMMTSKRAFRGVSAVRADASNANALIAQLQAAFNEFKAAQNQRLEGIDKKFDDVVQAEKVERINANISKLQGAVDQMNAQIAAASVNGAGGRDVRDPGYSKAFASFVRKGETADIQASLNKGTNADGGFTTPTEWDRTISDEMKLVSPVRQLVNVVPVSVHAASKLINKHGATSGWVGETAARPETTNPQFASYNIGWGEIYANPAATQQILDDSLIDIEAWLAAEVNLEFAYQEGVAVISGNGTNKPKGMLNYVTGGSLAADHPSGAITAVNSGAATAVTADGIINLIYALPSMWVANATFGMNRNSHGKVRLLKDGQNNYLWQPSYAAGQPATLAGYPLVEVPDMPDIAAGTKPILFGDWKRTYTLFDRFGVRVLRDPFTNKPYVMFYTTKRVGGAVIDPQAMKAQNISV